MTLLLHYKNQTKRCKKNKVKNSDKNKNTEKQKVTVISQYIIF